MTVKELEDKFKSELNDLYEASECESLAWLSVNYLCGYSRIQYLNSRETELSDAEEHHLNHILRELKTGRPLQYILGETEFYGLTFKLDTNVLIPRPETEELVDWILKDQKGRSHLSFLDIGTGSGCIAVSLQKNLDQASGYALDFSPGALKIASENAALNKVRLEFIEGDILHPDFRDGELDFDLIVSNPPYVKLSEKHEMHQNVLDFEPHTALFVPDEDALLFYRAIADYAASYLKEQGTLYLEINENLAMETTELLYSKGFRDIQLRQDLRSRDRMISAKFG